MKLQDQFEKWLDTNPRTEIRDVQLEVMAEKFAIDFAEWINTSKYYGTSKELLKIYKKENNL